MSDFIVSARKYRPDHFSSVVGQSHVTETLKNAIKNNQIAQAFLFCGPRGVGKTSCARILAKTLNCTNITADFEACGACESCVSFKKGTTFNIHELDAASNNSVDDIRGLVEQVRYAPQSGKYKVYIIDEVHMLSQSAFNAFLKTLEEPPAFTIFILATTEKHKIIPTILSRCQIFDFNRIGDKDMTDHLAFIATQEGIDADKEALHLIAQKSDGALRDALSSFDQISIFTEGHITYAAALEQLDILDYQYYFQITDFLMQEDIPAVLLSFDEVLKKGFSGLDFISGLCGHFRDLLVCKDEGTVKLLRVSESVEIAYKKQALTTNISFLLSALAIGSQCEIEYRAVKNTRLLVELALMKMCHLYSVVNDFGSQGTVAPVEKKSPIERSVAAPLDKATLVASLKTLVHTEKPSVPTTNLEKSVGAPTPPELPKKGSQASSSAIKIKIPSLEEIKKIMQPVDEKAVETDALPGRQLSASAFFVEWSKYLQLLEDTKKISLFTILSKHKPIIAEDQSVEIHVESAIQRDMVLSELAGLQQPLKEALDVRQLTLKVHILESDEEPKNLYTAQEKFNYLAAKNPSLLELKKRLDLEIDF